ncbi:hypothetical protein E4U42_008119, partial [Claviceps africana]
RQRKGNAQMLPPAPRAGLCPAGRASAPPSGLATRRGVGLRGPARGDVPGGRGAGL